jgi:glycine/D-amino acid oxidase-like deaminating enzyme
MPTPEGSASAEVRVRPVDLVVVGGGVAGLSLARAAARAGLGVTVLEREAGHGEAAHGETTSQRTSALPAALLNPWRGRKGAAHPDDRAGLATVRRWADELAAEGLEPGAALDGLLRIPDQERQARAWRERTEAEEDASLAWWPAAEVPEPYYAPHGALWVADGGWLRPARWLDALASSAQAHGAKLRFGAEVATIERSAARPWGLLDPVGTELCTAEAVAVAAGADALPAVRVDGAAVAWPEWTRTRGDVVTLAGGPAFPWPLAGGTYGASDGARAWIGGGHRPPNAPPLDEPERLRDAFAWAVPGLEHAPVASVWSAVRAKRPDARPDVREVTPGLSTFGAFAGRGFLCAAHEAERWVGRWTGGRSSADA